MGSYTIPESVYPIRCDPLMLWLRSRGVSQAAFLLLIYPFLLIVLLAVNLLQRTLSHPRSPEIAALDFNAVVLRQELTLEHFGGAHLSAYFPLMRDYPTFILFLLFAVWLAVIFRQWSLMERFIPELFGRGCLRPLPGREDEVHATLRRTNLRFEQLGRQTTASVIVGVLFAILIVFAHTRVGVFGALKPHDAASDWTRVAYTGWWASIQHPAGFILYLSIAVAVMYYIVKQNIAGILCIFGLNDLRKCVSVHFELTNVDGHDGWDIFRRCIMTVFWSGVIVGFALVTLLLVVDIAQLLWLLPFLIVLFVTTPLFLILPLVFLRRELKQRKAAMIAEVARREPGTPHRTIPGHRVDDFDVRSRLEAIRRLRTIPIRPSEAVRGALAYLVKTSITIFVLLDIFA